MHSDRPLRLFSGLALQSTLESAVLPAFVAEHAVELESTFEPTVVLVDAIGSGTVPDVFIGVRDSVARLVQEGVFEPSPTSIARSGVGVAVPPGAAIPNLATEEDLVAALRGARVAYSRTGASGIYFQGLLDRWGMLDGRDFDAVVFEKGFTAEAVVDGRADLAVQQVVELRTVAEAVIAGPFPPSVQTYIELDAAVRPDAHPLASALVEALVAARAVEAYRNAGMEPAPYR